MALVKVGNGTAPVGHLTPSLSWFNPFHNFTFSGFMVGFTLMLFIYWGWDTAVSVNEETKDSQTTPGRAAVLSTVVLLATYALVVLSTQSYAGIGTKGVGLENPNNTGDVLSVLGSSIFGTSGFANVLTHLLILMVLSSAAASTQTTILPTARTTLSMAVYKAIPGVFAKIHKKYLTPTVSTLAMGGVSIILYVTMNYLTSGGAVIDGLGLGPGHHDRLLLRADRIHLCLVLPVHPDPERTQSVGPGHHPAPRWRDPVVLHGMVLLVLLESREQLHHAGRSPARSRVIGGVFILDVGVLLLGIVLMYVYRAIRPAYFRGEVLNRDTPTRVPEDIGVPVGLFGIEEFETNRSKWISSSPATSS